MDKLIQMGKELGYEGQALQQFVTQQQDIERSERLAERELEKERIAAEKDKIAQVEKDREVELAKMAVARGVTLYRKRKHRQYRVRVIICPVREIVQVGAVVISAGVDEVMIIAIIS